MVKPKAIGRAIVNITRVEGADPVMAIIVRRTDKPGVVIRLEITLENFTLALTSQMVMADVTQWGGASFDGS
jgi:hypothetical protein